MSNSMKDKFLKDHELSFEDLEQVRGGITQNADGTYNIYDGQLIIFSSVSYAYVTGTYLNATGDTIIQYYRYDTYPNGDSRDEGDGEDFLRQLLPKIR